MKGIYTRPLGNVVYLMCGPLTHPETCRVLLQRLLTLLEDYPVQEILHRQVVVETKKLKCNEEFKQVKLAETDNVDLDFLLINQGGMSKFTCS